MSEEFVLDGVFEKIKEIDKILKCPFCDAGKLRVDKFYHSFSSATLHLVCLSCKIRISLCKEKVERKIGWFSSVKENKWVLEAIDMPT